MLFLFRVLLEELANFIVAAMKEFMEGAVKDETSRFEHQEGGVQVDLSIGKRDHAILIRIEAVSAHCESVLQAVRN
jgi:hypothetical protein